MTPNPTISQIMTSMASFLAAVLPSDVAVVQGQPNRVAAPSASRYVIMSPPRFSRLETNIDTSEDAVFTGSISGTTMTITAVDSRFPDAQLAIGDTVFGPTILPNTVITAGAGQVGTYTVSNSQTVAPGTISAGSTEIQMNAIATIQLDFHASDQTAGDLATVVSATMRDPFAVDQFANQSPNYGTVPIHADDPAQRPFFDDQQQVEWRFVVDALLQANIVVRVSKQFADSVALNLKSVFAEFPS